MASNKTRELELTIEQLKQELLVTKQLQGNLECEVSVYRAKESAIVNALTEAQSSALRIETEAREYADSVIANANAEARERLRIADEDAANANSKAAEIIDDAKAKGAEIIQNAEAEADRIIQNARESYDEYVSRIKHLNEVLESTARDAMEASKSVSEFLKAETPETDIDYAHDVLPLPIAKKPVEVPAEYDSPAELMQSIYAIQNRELPNDDKSTDTVDTVDEESEIPADAATESNEVEADDAEKVWTVDEITSTVGIQNSESDLCASEEELNAIINDVLNGD